MIDWQPNPERRSAAGVVFDPSSATVYGSELSDEREADPSAGHAIVGFAAVEELEDCLAFALPDPATPIVDGDQHERAVAFNASEHLGSRGRVLDRVGEQVLDDPFDLGCIDSGDDRLGLDVDQVAILRLTGAGVGDECANVGGPEARSEQAVPHSIQIEQIRKQPLEPPGLLDQMPNHLRPCLLIEIGTALLQGLREAKDRGQGGSQLVRDGRENVFAQLV